MRAFLLVATASLAFTGVGGLLGQRTELGVVGLILFPIVGLVSVLGAYGILSERRGNQRAVPWIAVSGCLAAAFVVGLWLGMTDFNRAYNECVQEGESVRQALADYRSRFGSFPPSLDQLHMVRPPGRLFLGGSILLFQATPAAYSLSFTDGAVRWSSNEKTPMEAVK